MNLHFLVLRYNLHKIWTSQKLHRLIVGASYTSYGDILIEILSRLHQNVLLLFLTFAGVSSQFDASEDVCLQRIVVQLFYSIVWFIFRALAVNIVRYTPNFCCTSSRALMRWLRRLPFHFDFLSRANLYRELYSIRSHLLKPPLKSITK